MTKQDYTHLTLVVDRSGSMASIRDDAQGGINTLIKEQAELAGEITVSLYEFDTSYEKVFGPIVASDAPTYILSPRGGTALLDATGQAISETGSWLRSLREDQRPAKVLFVIVTDGQENSSREYTKPQIKALIETQEAQWSWEFMYLGADMSTFADAAALGIRTATRYARTGPGAQSVYAAASSSLTSSRIGGQSLNSTMPSEIDQDGNAVSSS